MVFIGILAICKLKVTKIAQMVVVLVFTVGKWETAIITNVRIIFIVAVADTLVTNVADVIPILVCWALRTDLITLITDVIVIGVLTSGYCCLTYVTFVIVIKVCALRAVLLSVIIASRCGKQKERNKYHSKWKV